MALVVGDASRAPRVPPPPATVVAACAAVSTRGEPASAARVAVQVSERMISAAWNADPAIPVVFGSLVDESRVPDVRRAGSAARLASPP
jgi:hypothetical protein